MSQITISQDEQILFDKIKCIIAKNPDVKGKGYDAIIQACESSGMFDAKEISMLRPVSKDSIYKRILNIIREFLNN